MQAPGLKRRQTSSQPRWRGSSRGRMQGRLASMTCPRRAAGIPAGPCTVLLQLFTASMPDAFTCHLGVMPRLTQGSEWIGVCDWLR